MSWACSGSTRRTPAGRSSLVSYGMRRVSRAVFLDDIGPEPHAAVRLGFAIDALDFGLEPGEQVGGLLEDAQIRDHGLRRLGQPLARNDGRDPRRINHPQ